MAGTDRYGVEQALLVGELPLLGVPVAYDAAGGMAPVPALRLVVELIAGLGHPPRAIVTARALQALVDASRADPALWSRDDAGATIFILFRALATAVAPRDDPTLSPTGVVPLSPDMQAALSLGCAPPFQRPPTPRVALLGDGTAGEPGDWVVAAGGGGVAGVLLAFDRDSASGAVLAGVDVAPRDLPPPPPQRDALADTARPHRRRQLWLLPGRLRRATHAEAVAATRLGADAAALAARRAAFAPPGDADAGNAARADV